MSGVDRAMELPNYIMIHTDRGECKCGKCIDVGNAPDPTGPHTVNMLYFKVGRRGEPSADAFRHLTRAHPHAFGGHLDPYDGRDHSYMEVGAWLGSQGLAMQYMALGVMLGEFHLLDPVTTLSLSPDDPLVQEMIGQGFLSIVATRGVPQRIL